MRWLLNCVYATLLLVLSPVVLWRCLRYGRYRRGLRQKLFGPGRLALDQRPVVWLHAVSVGEVIQLQKIVREFRQQSADAWQIVVTTSTDTGYDLALQRFPDCTVTWFPLDFSWAVARTLRQLRPRLLVLMELEIWPNLLAACQRQGVAVAVVNARMSDRSFRGYQRIRRLLAPVLHRLSLVAAQSPQSASRLAALGVPAEHIQITGSIKFDGVATSRRNPQTTALREQLGLQPDDIVFIAGSTQDPEEQLALQAWLALQPDCPALRLILVPRHRERFDEVAGLVEAAGLPLLRRSVQRAATAPQPPTAAQRPVILLDTIGELGAAWGLADVAFVGGSFGSRGGQNMIEPAAYGAAVLFGPNTSNFRDVVAAFRTADACLQLTRPDDLLPTLQRLLADSAARHALGQRAQQVVVAQQGATQATAALLCRLLQAPSAVQPPATSPKISAAA